MKRNQAAVSVLCAVATLTTPMRAQTAAVETPSWHSSFTRPYTPRKYSPVDFSNSHRLESLMRAGRIYLSLQEAIALALENNLDIEYARYGPRIADSDILRASAGQLLRNNSGTGISSGPSSAGGGGVLAGANLLGSGGGGGGGGGNSGILSGFTIQAAGTTIPNLDPVVFASGNSGHSTSPLASQFVTGTNFLVSERKTFNYGIQQGFLTGTTATLGWNNSILRQNSPNNDFNPSTTSAFGFSFRQKLLQGWGRSLNARQITIAKNNRVASDLVFRSQVIATIANVVNLYFDLVTFNEILDVRKQALALNQKLYQDNRRRVQIGTLAPIEIVQAEAEVAASQQEATNAETQVEQQEQILKNVLSRTGVDSLMIAEARIVPTTKTHLADSEAIEPIQDLVAKAMIARPELEQNRIAIENSRLAIKGTKSALLPSLDLTADLSNNALSGQVNTVPFVNPTGSPSNLVRTRDPNSVNQFFLGGYGTAVGQLLRRNFPDYSIGFSLNIPLRNRAAQADLANVELDLRRQEIRDRQQRNEIRLNVLNAMIALKQARTAYETSVKARSLREQTLNAERKKYTLGASSLLNVIIAQRDLAAGQLAEVSALSTYARAKNQLDFVTGQTLQAHEVKIEEARTGMVSTPAALLPVLDSK